MEYIHKILNLCTTQDNSLVNIRRSRGYSYEHTLVQRLNNEHWIARRLGGSSTGLPDIVAVNNIEGILLSIEAKSGTGDSLYVKPDQIQRCLLIRDMFGYYKVADKLNKLDRIPIVKCTYVGKTYVMSDGNFTQKNLPNYILTFMTINQELVKIEQ